MYNMLHNSEWRCDLGKWRLVVTNPCCSKSDLEELLHGLVIAVLVPTKDCNNHVYWTGYIPPRTKNHLPLIKNLEEAKENALAFIRDRDGILKHLVDTSKEDSDKDNYTSWKVPIIRNAFKLNKVSSLD